MNTQTQNKRAFTIQGTAEYACVSRGTVENWITAGLLPYEKLPSRGNGRKRFILIRKVDLDAFLDNYVIDPRHIEQSEDIIDIINLRKCSELQNDS